MTTKDKSFGIGRSYLDPLPSTWAEVLWRSSWNWKWSPMMSISIMELAQWYPHQFPPELQYILLQWPVPKFSGMFSLELEILRALALVVIECMQHWFGRGHTVGQELSPAKLYMRILANKLKISTNNNLRAKPAESPWIPQLVTFVTHYRIKPSIANHLHFQFQWPKIVRE
jgi:hypothetical protein